MAKKGLGYNTPHINVTKVPVAITLSTISSSQKQLVAGCWSKASKPWSANRELRGWQRRVLSRQVSRGAWKRRINREFEAKMAHKLWIREGLNSEVQTVNQAFSTSKIPVFQFTMCTSSFAPPWVGFSLCWITKAKASKHFWDFFFFRNCGLLLELVRAQHEHHGSKCERNSGESLPFCYEGESGNKKYPDFHW